jgi:hypothetical protein
MQPRPSCTESAATSAASRSFVLGLPRHRGASPVSDSLDQVAPDKKAAKVLGPRRPSLSHRYGARETLGVRRSEAYFPCNALDTENKESRPRLRRPGAQSWVKDRRGRKSTPSLTTSLGLGEEVACTEARRRRLPRSRGRPF